MPLIYESSAFPTGVQHALAARLDSLVSEVLVNEDESRHKTIWELIDWVAEIAYPMKCF
jgi:hypothetical protein